MSRPSLEKGNGYEHDLNVEEHSAYSQAEDEAQIKARFATYGLGKLFDVGGTLYLFFSG